MDRTTFLIPLLLALSLAACGPASTPAEGPATLVAQAPTATEEPASPFLKVFDDAGREVILERKPERIVSLAPSNTEILFAVGAGPQVVGRDVLSDYPEQVRDLQDVGGSMGDFSVESIVALEPDLVLAAEINNPELFHQLEDLGLTLFYLRNPTTFEEMYTNLETVGRLTGHEQEAAVLVQSLQARVTTVDEKIASITERPFVFYELDSTDPLAPWTSGPGTFVDLLIDRAGGRNSGAVLQEPWAQISLEQLVVSNPSVIILGDSMWGVTVESVKARTGWDSLDGVTNDRIYPFDDNLVSRPGPRLVDGLEQMAKLLHPDLFE